MRNSDLYAPLKSNTQLYHLPMEPLFFEPLPLSHVDHEESVFLRNFKSREMAFPVVQHSSNRYRVQEYFSGKSKNFILGVSKRLPHGSSSRNAARQLIYSMPRFVREFIVSNLAAAIVFERRDIYYSLDLGFGLPTSDHPKVSIVIPVFNQWWVTFRCLRAIQSSSNICDYEVIVVDDASTDMTQLGLRGIRGVKVVRNLENVGYLESTNRGASFSADSSQYILLLNNDTEPIGNWIDELLEVFRNHPKTAIVGSTLFYSDGRIQESGGQIFGTANGWNIGRGFTQFISMFSFLREVDYCSAASLLVDKDFWQSVGGFDSRYKPAYYEDTDLAMSAWNQNLKVYVSPTSWVIHHEGISHGTSLDKGIKRYQEVNRRKFQEKWNASLKHHWEDHGQPRIERSRDSKGIIVLCDYQLPDVTRDSGSQRTVQLAQLLIKMKYHVVLGCIDKSVRQIQVQQLQNLGIEVYTDTNEMLDSLRYRSERILYYWTIRESVYNYFGNHLRGINNDVPVIADLLDLRFQDSSKKRILESHLKIANEVDLALLVSPKEAEQLDKITATPVYDIWYHFANQNQSYISRERSGLIFVGGFRHMPNVEGLSWFVHEVLPYLREFGFNEEIKVIGSGLSQKLSDEFSRAGLKIMGYQQDLTLHYKNVRLAISPLKSGAGLKGKIAEAFSFGVPVVTTSVGAEGFIINDSKQSPFLIQDTAEDFAKAIIWITKNETEATNMSTIAKNYVEEFLSEGVLLKRVQDALEIAQVQKNSQVHNKN